MKPSRTLLHAARLADAVLFWPVLVFVVWGELAAPDGGSLLGFIGKAPDKLLHFSAYFILGGMAAAAFEQRRPVIFAVLGLILLGVGLEILQGYVGRDMSAYDELANTMGAILGSGLSRVIVEILRRQSVKSETVHSGPDGGRQ